jgi:hypothetical protein
VGHLVLEGELEGVEMKAQEVLLTEKKGMSLLNFQSLNNVITTGGTVVTGVLLDCLNELKHMSTHHLASGFFH